MSDRGRRTGLTDWAIQQTNAGQEESVFVRSDDVWHRHDWTRADDGLPLTTQDHIGPQVYVGEHPRPTLFNPIGYRSGWRGPHKTSGGLWTSPLRETGDSAWIDWCRSERFERGLAGDWWQLWPESSATVLVIDSVADLRRVVMRFGGGDELNFWAIADAGYAGIHLTEQGEDETRFSVPDLYGWDCECTFWLRWCFVAIDELPKVEAA